MTRANVQVFSGDTDISSNLEVGGNTNLSSNLTVTGNTYISSNLTVVGNTYIESDLVLTGNATVTGIVGTSTMGGLNLPYGTTVERPNPAAVGTIRYNTDLKYVEAKTEAGWLVITSPPVISGVSPLNVSVDGIPTLKAWQSQMQVLQHNAPAASDRFGHCCAISADGNYMIVGAPYDHIPNAAGSSQADAGSAHIFIRAPSGDTTPSGTQWSYQATLTEPLEFDINGNQYFGYSVSISNDGMYAILGGYNDDLRRRDGDGTSFSEQPETTTNHSDNGSVLVFKRKPDGTWEFMDKVVHPTHHSNQNSDNFGQSCAMSGDGRYMIIGAPYDDIEYSLLHHDDDTVVTNAGAAHIFIREASGKWAHQKELTDFRGVIGNSENFGCSVSIDNTGTYVAIGANQDDRHTTNTGAAHIFKREGTIWNHMVEVTDWPRSLGSTSSEYFGNSVSISGDGKILAVGAYSASSIGQNNNANSYLTLTASGKVHMFRRDGEEWVREQILTQYYPRDVGKYDYFGYDVAVSNDGNYVVVGAPYDEHAGATAINGHGVTHLFKRVDSLRPGAVVNTGSDSNLVWTYVERLYDPSPLGGRSNGTSTNSTGERFGWTVSISGAGEYIANGAPYDHVVVNSSDVGDAGTLKMFTGVDVAGSNVVPSTEDEVFTVTGTGFTPGTIVKLVGVDGSLCDVFDMVIDANQTEITFKMGRNETTGGYDLEQRPYKVKVISDTGLATTSTDTIKLGGRWVSPGVDSVFPFSVANLSDIVSGTLLGVDAAGGNKVTYGVNPATPLPNGIFINSATGVISGKSTTAATTNVKARVIDTATQGYEEMNIKIAVYDGLYHFTSHTFTHCDQRGDYGPSLNDMVMEYSNTMPSIPWDQTTFLSLGYVSNGAGGSGYQKWTIPKDGVYEIDAYGARGGDGASGYYTETSMPGLGARVRARFSFLQGEKIIIIVGQTGNPPGLISNGSGSGGGASWVIKDAATTATDNIYVIAGGGTGVWGGASYYQENKDAPDANGTLQGASSGGGLGGNSNYGGGGGWGANGGGNNPGYHPHSTGARGGSNGAPGSRGAVGGFGGGGSSYNEDGGGGGGFKGGRGNHYTWVHPNASYYGSTSFILPDASGNKIAGSGDFLGNHTFNNGKVMVTYMGSV
jgi:hypothetical protein